MVQLHPTTKTCIIGAGAAGPAVAVHLADAGLEVVLLEAGKKFDINEDYTELPFDMLGVKFNWPFERKADPIFFDANGNMLVNRFGALIPHGVLEGQPSSISVTIQGHITMHLMNGTDSQCHASIRKRLEA